MHIEQRDPGNLLFAIVPKKDKISNLNKSIPIAKMPPTLEHPQILALSLFQTAEDAQTRLAIEPPYVRDLYEVRPIIAFSTTTQPPLEEGEKDYDSPTFDRIYGALASAGASSDTQDQVTEWLNENGFCNLTVCPECHVDDFTHTQSCKTGGILQRIRTGIRMMDRAGLLKSIIR